MRKFAITLFAVVLAGFAWTAFAQDTHKMTGVLIDNACGARQKDETAAAKHTIKCCQKDACASSGFQLVVGDKHYKLDDKGNEQAKEFLKTAKSTRVTVDGTMDGDMIKVASITAAPDEPKKG